MAAHQALRFCSNQWSSSSTPLLQQQQQRQQARHHQPDTLSFHQRKRPRSSISSSSSSSSSPPFLSSTYTNPRNALINANNDINPFMPIQPIINNNINPFFSNQITTNNSTFSNHHLFPTDIYGTSVFYDPPLSPQTLIPLDQEEGYYDSPNSLDFIYPRNALPDDHPILDFSSPEDQMLLAPLLADPLFTTSCVPDNHLVLEQEIVVETTNPNNDHHHHQNQRPKNGSTTVVSPQSIAARERRRKITERTSELGKLIPGGNKMSTAEMFQAAYKYVKFLQAQVSLLQLLASSRKVIFITFSHLLSSELNI